MTCPNCGAEYTGKPELFHDGFGQQKIIYHCNKCGWNWSVTL